MAPAKPSQSPEERAAKRHEDGQRARDEALAYEAKARVSDEKGFLGLGSRPSEKAVKQWHKAVKAYREAVRDNPKLYEAYSDLGFAYRKLGNYEKSLAAFDRALELSTTYAPAIESRGETYLELARLDDARKAYTNLLLLDQALASQLMKRMQEWLVRAAQQPVKGVSPDEVEAFRRWVEEREEVAASRSPDEVSEARSR